MWTEELTRIPSAGVVRIQDGALVWGSVYGHAFAWLPAKTIVGKVIEAPDPPH